MSNEIDESLRIRFDADRPWHDKAFRSACYAPFSSMYLDQRGFVRVCCQNYQHSIGNLTHQSIDEIWNGARAQLLRGALKRYDFSLGCQYCEWQLREGNVNNFAREYDIWPMPSEETLWPAQMEFSISNTCNLECMMCNGEWSSSIRTRREKLPPLPKVYGDSFFEDLRKYLPHLKRLRFLGGEPFLAQEHYRIWDMLIDAHLSPEIHVTTNGTQWNAKVERVLEHFPVSISVSMDGVSKETVETVRKNADYNSVLSNVERFRDYARSRGTWFGLTYCLMPANWHEFGDYMRLADSWNCSVTVNTVLHPPEFSFYTMSAEELKPYVDGLSQQAETFSSLLTRNKDAYLNEIDRLRHRMLHAEKVLIDFVPGKLVQLQTVLPRETDENEGPTEKDRKAALDELARWSENAAIAELWCDDAERVTDVPTGDFLGVSREACLSRPVDSVYALLRMRYGGMTAVHRQEKHRLIDRLFGFQSTDLIDRTLRMITYPSERGSITLATIIDEPYLSASRRPRFPDSE